MAKPIDLDLSTWLIEHFSLPEELEGFRAEALARAVPPKETDPMWRRLRTLGDALERQRRRSETLAELLAQERARNAELGKRLAERDPADAARILRLRGLVRELRDETERLRSLVPAEAAPAPEEETTIPASTVVSPHEDDALIGKTVAVFGWPGEHGDVGGVTLRWHHGDRWVGPGGGAAGQGRGRAGGGDAVLLPPGHVGGEGMGGGHRETGGSPGLSTRSRWRRTSAQRWGRIWGSGKFRLQKKDLVQ